jgi:transposase
MRGAFVDQGMLFSYISPEARVPPTHPLRKIRELGRDVLGELNRSLAKLYASEGRPSIAPEQLLSALLLHASAECARSGLDLRLVVQNDIQQGAVNFDAAVVGNEP